VTALDELEKRLDGPGLIVALAKDEARDLLSAAREGEKDKARLRVAVEALGEVDQHIPDQPASADGDELLWARRHVGKLRGIARAALATIEDKPHDH